MDAITLKFGEYKNVPLNEIPWEYILWLFPKLLTDSNNINTINYTYPLKTVTDVLDYCISLGLDIEDKSNEGKGFIFYRSGYELTDPDGNIIPLFQSFWRGLDSSGNYVYELISHNQSIFVVDENGIKSRSLKFISHKYNKSGVSMIYEKTDKYYFYDGYERLMYGSYLMRLPYIPDREIVKKFSKNIPIST